MKDFKDKVVFITGGATGIGFSFAKQLSIRPSTTS
jgi:NAD(P)-dependent dehydrogenase (short-subunit alcohol dehydrogenase family)